MIRFVPTKPPVMNGSPKNRLLTMSQNCTAGGVALATMNVGPPGMPLMEMKNPLTKFADMRLNADERQNLGVLGEGGTVGDVISCPNPNCVDGPQDVPPRSGAGEQRKPT